MHAVPASYLEAHRYDGAAIEHGHREALEYCALQPRDVAIVRDVWRYKFLTGPQLRELWWPQASVQAADRRLLKLFRAGHVDRFRPYARRGTGSYPWTYHLGEEGHHLLQHAGDIPHHQRHRPRQLFDYSRVVHDVQLNAWILAYRRAVGHALLAWHGEASIEPPAGLRRERERFEDDWSREGLHDDRARSICPDAILEIPGDPPAASSRLIFIEYDRTSASTRTTKSSTATTPSSRGGGITRASANAQHHPSCSSSAKRTSSAISFSMPPIANSAATAGTPTSRQIATNTSDASGSSSRPRSTPTPACSRPDGCQRSQPDTNRAMRGRAGSG